MNWNKKVERLRKKLFFGGGDDSSDSGSGYNAAEDPMGLGGLTGTGGWDNSQISGGAGSSEDNFSLSNGRYGNVAPVDLNPHNRDDFNYTEAIRAAQRGESLGLSQEAVTNVSNNAGYGRYSGGKGDFSVFDQALEKEQARVERAQEIANYKAGMETAYGSHVTSLIQGMVERNKQLMADGKEGFISEKKNVFGEGKDLLTFSEGDPANLRQLSDTAARLSQDPTFGEMPMNQQMATIVAVTQQDMQIQGTLGRGLIGAAAGSPVSAVVGGLAGIANAIWNKDDYFNTAYDNFEVDQAGRQQADTYWTDRRTELLSDEQFQQSISGAVGSAEFNPENQSIVAGQIVNNTDLPSAGVPTPGDAPDGPGPTIDQQIAQFDTASLEAARQAILDVDTDIQYQHTLAELSGIQLSDEEKSYFDTQKQTAIDRTIGEIEDTFAPLGETIIAQQIHNLGANALGGTIGQEFTNRWQEKKAKTKANAMSDIESTYLAAEQSELKQKKQWQLDMWGKEYDSDVKQAELNLDKNKSSALIQYDWDRNYLNNLTTRREQDLNVEQQNLDRLLRERMGNQEYEAWEDSNTWGAVGGIAGSVIGSDWFGDAIGSWF